MWKDKGLQLVMLPTDNDSLLHLSNGNRLITSIEPTGKSDLYNSIPQYLYLSGDEKPKYGDMCLDGEYIFGPYEKGDVPVDGEFRSIIASTDPSLNLPSFPDSFLEEYVKRYNSKKSLEVEVEHRRATYDDWMANGAQPIKKELIVISNNTISIRFKEEKMYSQAQMEMRLLEGIGHAISYPETFVTGICLDSTKTKNWIKENLK